MAEEKSLVVGPIDFDFTLKDFIKLVWAQQVLNAQKKKLGWRLGDSTISNGEQMKTFTGDLFHK